MNHFLKSTLIVSTILFSSCSNNQFAIHKKATESKAQKVMVSTQGDASTAIALDIIKKGGNIFDAAVAASFSIGVERPHSTGVTGGGFAILYEAKTGKTYAFDFRERAPKKSFAEMFQDKDGNIIKNASTNGILAGAVPGMVQGLESIHKRFGKLKWAEVVEPSIQLAEKGFPVYPELETAIKGAKDEISVDVESKGTFLNTDGSPKKAGDLLVQNDLAQTLKEFQKLGSVAWTKGQTGKKFIAFENKNHGLITLQDLKSYAVKEREVVRGKYKNFEIVSMPPPSSGGLLIVQMLNMLEGENLKQYPPQSVEVIHRYASAMQLAYADRAAWLGDPDFFKVPSKGLTSKEYALKRWKNFDPKKHEKSALVSEGDPRKFEQKFESDQTTHISLMDEEGNVVVTTHTINGHFGAGMIVDGTGMVLNNEMDDFSAKAGVPNMFGALGGTANEPLGMKTPLSSMSPTIVFENGKPVLAIGSPSGTRIITCVMQVMMNVLEWGMPLEQAQSSVRIHYQWQPDVLSIEPPMYSKSTIKELEKMGYKVEPKTYSCRVQAVLRTKDGLTGSSDPRGAGRSEGI